MPMSRKKAETDARRDPRRRPRDPTRSLHDGSPQALGSGRRASDPRTDPAPIVQGRLPPR